MLRILGCCVVLLKRPCRPRMGGAHWQLGSLCKAGTAAVQNQVLTGSIMCCSR